MEIEELELPELFESPLDSEDHRYFLGNDDPYQDEHDPFFPTDHQWYALRGI